MNAIKTLLATCATFIITAAPAFAASGRNDHSGLVVWTFLGFCGLIIAAQLVPAFLVLCGLVKGITQTSESSGARSA